MRRFPEHFIFGIGDADLQVTGEKYAREAEGSQETMWAHLAPRSGKVYQNHTPLEGVDRFHRWQEDVNLLLELGVRHYRTSVSMARLFLPDGTVNRTALLWYQRYFGELCRRGIEVYVTLYHWELPLALHERGGWTNRSTAEALANHASVVARELDEFITEYFVINEHVCIAYLGYYAGLHAPFEADLGRAIRAAHHLLVGQGLATAAIKDIRPSAKVGTVYNLCPPYALTTETSNLEAQKGYNGMYLDWLLEPVYTGRYPEELLPVLGKHLPDGYQDDSQLIRVGGELSTLGLNYYCGQTVEFDPDSPSRSRPADRQFQIRTGLGWPVYVSPENPRGLYDVLVRTYARYELLGLRRIVITENGTAWPIKRAPDGSIDDEFRIEFVREHLAQVWDAIRFGVPVEGYFLWTLLDNYEWQEGFRPESCFGIVHVARDTLERTPKRSFSWYREVIRKHAIDSEGC